MKKQVTKAASMSDAAKTGDTPFNLDQLRQLFELMEKHGVNTVNLHSSGERWRVQRGLPQGGAPVFAAPQMPAYAPPAVQPQPLASAATAAPAASSVGENSGELIIKSPTVGTFYVSPTPEDPPFVSIGSAVSSQTIVCIIEAMKVFNQIPAEVSGTITAMLVKNGDPVEFGQPLFRVKP